MTGSSTRYAALAPSSKCIRSKVTGRTRSSSTMAGAATNLPPACRRQPRSLPSDPPTPLHADLLSRSALSRSQDQQPTCRPGQACARLHGTQAHRRVPVHCPCHNLLCSPGSRSCGHPVELRPTLQPKCNHRLRRMNGRTKESRPMRCLGFQSPLADPLENAPVKGSLSSLTASRSRRQQARPRVHLMRAIPHLPTSTSRGRKLLSPTARPSRRQQAWERVYLLGAAPHLPA